MRFYMCLLCDNLRIKVTNIEKKSINPNICLICQNIVLENKRLGELIK